MLFRSLMDLTHYQVYAPLNSNSIIKVETKGADVISKIGKIADGRAVIRCTYNGKEKVFMIN